MKSTLLIAALFAATTASAQSTLTLPNNSAGTPMDTPPAPPAAKDVDVTSGAGKAGAEKLDYLTKDEFERLQEHGDFNAADANGDGKIDAKELQRYLDSANRRTH